MARYIDADALCKVFEKRADDEWNKKALAGTWSDVYRDMIDAIDDEPTADVKPVKYGHWIEHHDDIFPLESTIECSVCGEQENVNIHNDNFCPNCGAIMDGGNSE